LTADRRLKRILVVEDDPEQSVMTELVLKFGGYTVLPAASGEQALAYARQDPLSLVILDMRLGEHMDGYDVLAALKADPTTADIPVLVLTAYDGMAQKARAMALGAECYEAKPYVAADFIDEVKHCLEAHRQERREQHRERRGQYLKRRGHENRYDSERNLARALVPA
jgi:CheY-like chemotaxis protein